MNVSNKTLEYMVEWIDDIRWYADNGFTYTNAYRELQKMGMKKSYQTFRRYLRYINSDISDKFAENKLHTNKPFGCTFPNCFSCEAPDCEAWGLPLQNRNEIQKYSREVFGNDKGRNEEDR